MQLKGEKQVKLSLSYWIAYLKSKVQSLSSYIEGKKEVSQVRQDNPQSKGAKWVRKSSKGTHSKIWTT